MEERSLTSSRPDAHVRLPFSGPLAPKLLKEQSPWSGSYEGGEEEHGTVTDCQPGTNRPPSSPGTGTGARSSTESCPAHGLESPATESSSSAARLRLPHTVSFHKTTVTTIFCFQQDSSPSTPIRSAQAGDISGEVAAFVEKRMNAEERSERTARKKKQYVPIEPSPEELKKEKRRQEKERERQEKEREKQEKEKQQEKEKEQPFVRKTGRLFSMGRGWYG